MYADAEQLAKVCSSLLARVGLGRLWSTGGPTPEARLLLEENGRSLTKNERATLLLAWALWNRSGGLTVAELLEDVDDEHLGGVGALLVAMWGGRDGIAGWLDGDCDAPPVDDGVAAEDAEDDSEVGGGLN